MAFERKRAENNIIPQMQSYVQNGAGDLYF